MELKKIALNDVHESLGAKMVLIGRSTLYGTAAAGQAGAARALEIYRSEISRSMAQICCNKVSEIGPQHVAFQNDGRLIQPTLAPHVPAHSAANVQPLRAAE